MTLPETILAGAIGGLITTAFLPIITYFGLRKFNRSRIVIKIDRRNESDYKVYNLRIHNTSYTTLKNVIACISVDNQPADIIVDSRIKIFCSDAKVERGLLSWSKNVDNKNSPEIDLNQGEEQDINFIRYHSANPDDAIEIASEQGFYEYRNESQIPLKSRTVLKGSKSYTLDIFVTGDNFLPIKRTLSFKPATKEFVY